MLEFLETKLFWMTAVAIAIYLYLKYYVYYYWQRHGVPYDQPLILLGNIPLSFFFGKISVGNFVKANYEKFCKKHRFHGLYMFHKPVIMITDPDLIRLIFIKEAHHFPDRGWFGNVKSDPLSHNLFLLEGEQSKKIRAKLTPAFTSGKLKQMYEPLVEINKQLIRTCEAELKESDILDIKDIMSRYTIDIISTVVFGLNCNSLEDANAEFHHIGKKAVDFGRVNLLLGIFVPELLKFFNLKFHSQEITNFFVNSFTSMVEYRQKNNIVVNDFLNLLMQLMNHGEISDEKKKNDDISKGVAKGTLQKLNADTAAAQAFLFFTAGYETTSSAITYCLFELAMNPDIQNKLREEINRMADTENITYDSIMTNEYLDMVFSETLRKHPTAAVLDRTCSEDFPIPNSNFTIPKGMHIIISTTGVHRNPKIYPDPEKFDPSRYSKENSNKNESLNLGFGIGPRYCIGKQLGKLKAKLAIVTMLRNYKIYISKKTDVACNYSTKVFMQMPDDLFLRLEKINV